MNENREKDCSLDKEAKKIMEERIRRVRKISKTSPPPPVVQSPSTITPPESPPRTFTPTVITPRPSG